MKNYIVGVDMYPSGSITMRFFGFLITRWKQHGFIRVYRRPWRTGSSNKNHRVVLVISRTPFWFRGKQRRIGFFR